MRRRERDDVIQRDLIIPKDVNIGMQHSQVLVNIPCEGIVIVDQNERHAYENKKRYQQAETTL